MFIIDDLLATTVRSVGSILGKILTVRHAHRVRKAEFGPPASAPSTSGEDDHDHHRQSIVGTAARPDVRS